MTLFSFQDYWNILGLGSLPNNAYVKKDASLTPITEIRMLAVCFEFLQKLT